MATVTRNAGGGSASGARGTSAPSVSSMAWLVRFKVQLAGLPRQLNGCEPLLRVKQGGERGPEAFNGACSPSGSHLTIAGCPAGLGRPAAQEVACVAEPAHGDDIRAAATTEPQLGPPLLPPRRRGNDGATRALGAVWRADGPLLLSAGVEGGNPIIFALPGCCEGIRPHHSRGVVVGAETARVGGLQRLAILSRHEAIDGMLAPQCV